MDRVGNHFQTLSQGKKVGKEKQRLEQKDALLFVCACACAEVEVEIGCVFEVGLCVYACVCTFFCSYTNPPLRCQPPSLSAGGGQRSPDSTDDMLNI